MIDAISSATGSVAQTLLAMANPRTVGSRGGETAQGSIKGVESAESVQSTKSSVSETELTDEERAEVEKLKQRDQEVRRHEQAHKAAAGQHARGGPSFEYETGPDGRQYATGGHVDVDTSPVAGDPQATIAKMQQIRRAALAPGEPSSEDRQIAAQAAQKEQQARAELAKQKASGETDTVSGATGAADVNAAATILGTDRPRPTASSGTETAIGRSSGTSAETNHGRPVDRAYSASSVGFIRPGRFLDVHA